MANPISVAYVAKVVVASAVVGAGSAIVFDLNSIVVSGGAVLVAVIGIIAPLYFKLISDGRANKAALAQISAAALLAAEAAKVAVVDQAAKMKEMNEKVDGKMDKQLATEARASMAEGQLKGAADEQARVIQEAGIINAVDTANTDIVKAVKEGPSP